MTLFWVRSTYTKKGVLCNNETTAIDTEKEHETLDHCLQDKCYWPVNITAQTETSFQAVQQSEPQ